MVYFIQRKWQNKILFRALFLNQYNLQMARRYWNNEPSEDRPVLELLAAGKLTVKEISKKTGISESTIHLRLRNPGTLRQSEIVEIAKVLKMSPFKLVSQRLEYVIE